MGGTSTFDAGNDLVVDPAGDIVIAGHFRGMVNFGGGDRISTAGSVDMFVAKYEGSSGEHRWSLVYGGSEGDGAQGLAMDGSDVVVTGSFLSDDASFGGSTLGRVGDQDTFLARYRGSNGQHQWSLSQGGLGDDEPLGIASQRGKVTLTGRYAASPISGDPSPETGETIATYDAAIGSRLWSADRGASPGKRLAVAMTTDGTAVIAGSFSSAHEWSDMGTLEHAGGSDVVIARYRGDTGEPLWVLAAGSPGLDAATAVSARGNMIVVAGYFEDAISIAGMDVASPAGGLKDMFIVRLQEE
jgi:hypothetical protein